MLQLRLSYQQFYCLLRCELYYRFYSTCHSKCMSEYHNSMHATLNTSFLHTLGSTLFIIHGTEILQCRACKHVYRSFDREFLYLLYIQLRLFQVYTSLQCITDQILGNGKCVMWSMKFKSQSQISCVMSVLYLCILLFRWCQIELRPSHASITSVIAKSAPLLLDMYIWCWRLGDNCIAYSSTVIQHSHISCLSVFKDDYIRNPKIRPCKSV